MSEYIPFNITTDAGKELWHEMNQHYGSVVWGRVGDGIEAVEAEMRERIIALLETCCKTVFVRIVHSGERSELIALINGEK